MHSEGKRDIPYNGVVTPSKTSKDFSLTTIEEKVDSLFTRDVFLTPEKTAQVQFVPLHRHSRHPIRIKPQKKIVSLLLVFLLLFVVVVAAPFVNISDRSDFMVSISPTTLRTGEYLYVNMTVPILANITSGSCVIDGIETINLSLVDTTPAYQVWQAVWMVHNVSMGEYVATITLIDQENTSYYAEG